MTVVYSLCMGSNSCHENLLFLKQLFAQDANLWGEEMLILKTSNSQGATIRSIVSRPEHHYLLFTIQFSSVGRLKKIIVNYFQLFEIKGVKEIFRIWRKQTNCVFGFLFLSDKPALSKKKFHGRELYIRVFSTNGRYGQILVTLSRWV